MLNLFQNIDPKLVQPLLIGGMVVVFYFFSIRPQRRRQHTQQQFMQNLKPGTAVVTIGGLHGKVLEVASGTITLSIGGGAELVVAKRAISVEDSRRLEASAV